MAKETGIQWTDHTLNLWWGCVEVHSGCDNCYAREWAKTRFKKDIWGVNIPRLEILNAFSNLASWQRTAEKEGVQRYVFCSSMSDIFEKAMPVIRKGELQAYKTDALRIRLFQEIEENKYPNLIFQFLTKRPSNIPKMIPESWQKNGTPRNTMFGTSISTQKDMILVQHLLKVNGKTFLSIEPLLEHINFTVTDLDRWGRYNHTNLLKGNLKKPSGLEIVSPEFEGAKIDWVIVGGESGGKNARPMHPDWVRSIRDQCKESGTAFFFKQWGEWGVSSPDYLTGYLKEHSREYMKDWNIPESGFLTTNLDTYVYEKGHDIPNLLQKVGKKAAGNLIDGVQHKEFPKF